MNWFGFPTYAQCTQRILNSNVIISDMQAIEDGHLDEEFYTQ